MDIISALESGGIEYVTEGKNVSPGNINIKCPWCGEEDPSFHLGISLETGFYGCWRNPSHSGRKVAFLLSKILGISVEAAGQRLAPDISTLRQTAQRLLPQTKPTPARPERGLAPDPSFRPIAFDHFTAPYARYLEYRGFEHEQIEELVRYYRLRASLYGEFACRIIFPVFHRGVLVAWTGRAIGKTNLRYKSHPVGKAIKEHLLFFDLIKDRPADILSITEGPFDALNVDWHGRQFGMRATCLFGKVATDKQLQRIMALAPLFKKVVVMFDADAWSATLDLYSRLAPIRGSLLLLPDKLKDPGSMTPSEVYAFRHKLARLV